MLSRVEVLRQRLARRPAAAADRRQSVREEPRTMMQQSGVTEPRRPNTSRMHMNKHTSASASVCHARCLCRHTAKRLTRKGHHVGVQA